MAAINSISLVLVAPPGVLTELKQKLSKPMAKIVASDLQKDLTKVPDHDLDRAPLPGRLAPHRARQFRQVCLISFESGGSEISKRSRPITVSPLPRDAFTSQTAMIRRFMRVSLAPGCLHTSIEPLAGNDNSEN